MQPYKHKVRKFGKTDDRFTALLNREALDPQEGLVAIRRILEFTALAPAQLTVCDFF
tara:strand:+ start:137 stop:307 length:171 start_codon:yes stop_codon:yes gene_type:complete